MRYRLFIIILLLTISIQSIAQHYTIEKGKYPFKVAVQLYNNAYGLELIYDKSHIVVELSFGMYIKSGDTVLLHDMLYNFNLKAHITDSSITFVDGYQFLVGERLLLDEYSSVEAFDDYRSIQDALSEFHDKRATDALIFTDKLGNNGSDTFETGIYGGQRTGIDSLDANGQHVEFTDSMYEYRNDGYVLSKGLWKRVGNYLMLKDETLNTWFRLKITGNNTLYTDLLPPAYWPIPLYLCTNE